MKPVNLKHLKKTLTGGRGEEIESEKEETEKQNEKETDKEQDKRETMK